jgi:hypothetical protein
MLSPTEIVNSWDGAYLNPNLDLRMLNILINIIYDVTPDQDPYKDVSGFNIGWPHIGISQAGINVPGTIPTWLEDLFDIEEEDESNINGMFTKKYYESSFGNLHLIGDFIVVNIPQSYVIDGIGSDGTFGASNLIRRAIEYINDNDGLETVYGHNSIADYKLPNGEEEIHFGSVIFRNSKPNYGTYPAGIGSMCTTGPILFNDGNSYPLRAGLLFCSGPTESWILNPVSVMNHEMGHALIAPDNNMHYGGGNGWINNSGRVFLQLMGGYGLMGQSSTGLVSANAFDRWWLHWKSPIYNNTESYIAASNQVSDISFSDGNKTFILRDFVTTGDAIRIKLPYVDAGAKNQYIWLENHKIGTNGKIDFLTYSNTDDYCRPQGKPGIYAYYQVGKDILTGESTVIRPSGQSDHLKPISAEGNFNYTVPVPGYKVYECVMGPTLQRAKKNDPNPFMGTNDIMAHFKNTGNNPLSLNDAFGAFSKNHYANGQWIDNDSLPYLMDDRDPFRGECFFNLSTNPAPVPTTTYYNEVSGININKETITDNNTIYLSGLSIFMVPLPNGDYKVSIDWNRNTVENDVVWTGKIAMTDRLYVNNGSVVELKQNLTPCQVNKDPIANQYAPVTEFFCKENSLMTFSGHSMMDVSEKSKIHILSSSVTTFEDYATLTIKAGSELIIESCANLVLKGQAKLIVEPDGILTVKPGASIFVDNASNLDLKSGYKIGVGGINIFENNFLGIPPSNTITTNTTWTNANYKFFDDLYIAPGATLTLSNCELKFFRTAKVKVARGAKLEMSNNCNLTTSCNSELWNGVEVWGNPSVSQTPATNQGHLVMSNSKIEFARTGVLLDKPMYPTENTGTPGVPSGNGGGIIQAVNSSFTNNYIGVSFSPYIFKVGDVLVNNESYFQNCTFSGNQFYPMANKVIDSHCNLNGVIGIDFKKCSFLASNEGLGTVTKVSYGIRSHNSNFLVDGLPLNGKYQRSVFKNLKYGVFATASLSIRNFTVRNCVFKENNVAMFASSVNNVRITENLIIQPIKQNDLKFTMFGIYLEYCDKYTIQQDSLWGVDFWQGENKDRSEAGILIKNSGPSENLVYNNLIWGFQGGVIAEGENRGSLGTGLCIKCNVFLKNATDIHAIPFGGGLPSSQGIRANQGSNAPEITAPGGNIFTDKELNPSSININNEFAEPINYFFHTNTGGFNVIPPANGVLTDLVTVFRSPGINLLFRREHACPPKLNYNDSKDALIAKTDSLNTALMIKENELSSLIDDSDTPLMLNNVVSSAPFEALWLHDELLSTSPFLSDTVLIEAGKKEDVLNSAMIRDVMVANPHAAKTPEVMNVLEQRVEPIPDELMAEIEAGKNQIGAKQELEINISDISSELSFSKSRLLDLFYDVNDYDSIRWVLVQFPEPMSEYQKAWTWFDEGNTSNGLSAIQNINLLSLPEHHRNSQSGYTVMAEIFNHSANDTSYLLQNDSVVVQALFALADSDNPAGVAARNLLFSYRLVEFNPTVTFPDSAQKSTRLSNNSKSRSNKAINELQVFPNPANDFIIIDYELVMLGKLRLIAQDGRICYSQNLNAGRNQLMIRLNNFSPGVYIATIVQDKKVISSKFTVK